MKAKSEGADLEVADVGARRFTPGPDPEETTVGFGRGSSRQKTIGCNRMACPFEPVSEECE